MSDELKPTIGHLTLRVPWHDRKWSGHVCDQPAANSFCVMLDRIREKRVDELEARVAGQGWAQLKPEELPPCIAENGGFMNASLWRRRFEHPYVNIASVRDSHGVLERTWVEVPEYATFAVPFWWMLRKNQRGIDDAVPIPLPPDSDPPFESPWVFDAQRQRELLKHVFGQVTEAGSLAIFYTKDGHPFGEGINRLIVGIGTVTRVSGILEYRSHARHTYPLWDTLISHSIRPDGATGFLLPYHEYLRAGHDGANPGDPLNEILVVPDSGHTREFSYGAEIAGPDVALATLVRCLEAVRQIRKHGIAHGPWERREEWLNKQIAAVWKARGAYPGLGSALEAFGLRLGTSLYRQLVVGGTIDADDTWAVIDGLFRGKVKAPEPDYAPDLESLQGMWIELPDERRALLKLLSRFDLSPQQAKRWYDAKRRTQATLSTVTDSDIIANPYLIAENDLGDGDEPAVSFGTLDRGLRPDPAIRVRYPIPEPSAVATPTDDRRLRAALVAVLRQMETEGDTLLSVGEASERSTRLDASTPVELPPDWLTPGRESLKGHVELVQATLGQQEKTVLGVQLARTRRFEAQLRKVLLARSARMEQAVVADWPVLLKEAITAAGGEFDADNSRHVQALSEQAAGLETVVSRRATTLVGRAGTGKTSVLGAMLLCPQISAGGVLLLAPTGKATVRLAGAARAEARTIASFLHGLGRYDVRRNRVLVQGTKRYAGASTVIIDECSMLTLEMLVALLDALDLQRVKRLILVGDPNQLPPIGAGRPFADFVAFLDEAGRSDDEQVRRVGSAQARLTVEVRSTAGEPSDTLRLASWFTREPQPVDADRVLSDLELGHSFNDLQVCYWRTGADLRGRLIEQFQQHLGLNSEDDVNAFNRALGLDDDGQADFSDLSKLELFQILTPVRKHLHGVQELNRWVQRSFRKHELDEASRPYGLSLGDEQIVLRDRVIQLKNGERPAYDWEQRESTSIWLANGEIGLAAQRKGKWLNFVFAQRPNKTIGYRSGDFAASTAPLELAYALTVHKAQGSEFSIVFFVLPARTRLLSRELVYTALTRSKSKLVLLIEGDSTDRLFDLSKPDHSETIRRNTNLFLPVLREERDTLPYAENLIHRTLKGHMVRSKSELAIANMLFSQGVDYEYERRLDGEIEPGRVRPDFSFVTAAGDLLVWEHLGMVSRADYMASWRRKLQWYTKNGFELGEQLFTTEDDERGGLDSQQIQKALDEIRERL